MRSESQRRLFERFERAQPAKACRLEAEDLRNRLAAALKLQHGFTEARMYTQPYTRIAPEAALSLKLAACPAV